MTGLSTGQEVTVSGMHGGAAEVVYVRGGNVRVRMLSTRCPRTVPLSRVTPKRESKALSVGPMAEDFPLDMPKIARAVRRAEGYACDRLRPVPKPVTLTSPAYLAYVRKHPCCLCGASGPSEPHHWSHHGGVMGAKVDDYRTVPLCTEHHRYWHDHGTLPGHDRVGSEWRFLLTQRALLTAWTDDHTRAPDMVDALIRAIGGQS